MSGLEVFGAVVAAADTIDKVIKLVNTIRHAQDQAEVLSSELKSLNVNLQALRRLSANGVPHFDQTSVLAVGADACDRKAQEILRELEGVQKSKREQLKWPFRKDHCEDLLKELRAFSNILHFAISLDTINLLTKSTEEVKKSLKLQVESLGILTEINDAVRRVEHKVEQGFAEVEKAEASRRRDKILSSIDDRLRSLGNTKQDLRHSDISDSRNGRTGSWFLDDSTFKQWLGVNESRDSSQFASNILSNEHALNHADGRSHTYSVIPTQPPNNVFLCQGPPGSGKSTLASLVIEHVAETVTDTPSSMVYYYINYSDKQDHLVLNLVLCFLRQMLQNLSSAASQTMQTQDRLASVLSESSIPKPGVLTSILQQMVQAHSTFYVVLDALDELHLSSQPSVFEFLSDFASQPNVKMFVTTRHTGDLGRVFPSSTAFDFEAAGADIRQYIQDKVVQHNRFAFNPVDDTLKSDMMWQIVSTARGMFLLAKLLLESVLNSVSATTRRETLEKMPKFKDLDSFLEETLDRIREQPNSDRTAIAIDAFLWILHAVRLPRVDDMREALSMSLSDKPLSFENWPQLDLIIDCCQGLVHVGPGGRLLMIHKSVYDYLKGHTPDDWKHRRARLTLQYVKDPAFSKGPTSDLELYQKEHPFLNSLVHGWVTYLEQAYKADWSVWSDLFFQHRPNVSFMYQYNRWHQRYKHQYFDVEEAKSVTPLILICTIGIPNLAKRLLDEYPSTLDQSTAIVRTTPLIVAASAAQPKTFRLLIERGADLYKENWYGNALHCAAEAGSVKMCRRMVLEFGMDPNGKSERGRTPLHCTLDSDRVEAFKELIDVKASPESVSFSMAADRQCTAILKYMVTRPDLWPPLDATSDATSAENPTYRIEIRRPGQSSQGLTPVDQPSAAS